MCGCGKSSGGQVGVTVQAAPKGWLVTFSGGRVRPIRYLTTWEVEIALKQDPGATSDPAYVMPDGTVRGTPLPAG